MGGGDEIIHIYNLFYFECGSGSPAKSRLFGTGVGAEIYVKSDSAEAGVLKAVEILPKSNIEEFAEIAGSCRIRLKYETSVLYPFDRKAERHFRNDSTVLTVESKISPDKQYLAKADFITCIGRVEETTIDIIDAEFFDSDGNRLNIEPITQSGTFKILGICREGGRRLINPTSDYPGIVDIIPNPAHETVNITLNLTSKGETSVVITDLLGKEVKTILEENIQKPEVRTITVNLSGIASGRYYMCFSAPGISSIKPLEISD